MEFLSSSSPNSSAPYLCVNWPVSGVASMQLVGWRGATGVPGAFLPLRNGRSPVFLGHCRIPSPSARLAMRKQDWLVWCWGPKFKEREMRVCVAQPVGAAVPSERSPFKELVTGRRAKQGCLRLRFCRETAGLAIGGKGSQPTQGPVTVREGWTGPSQKMD